MEGTKEDAVAGRKALFVGRLDYKFLKASMLLELCGQDARDSDPWIQRYIDYRNNHDPDPTTELQTITSTLMLWQSDSLKKHILESALLNGQNVAMAATYSAVPESTATAYRKLFFDSEGDLYTSWAEHHRTGKPPGTNDGYTDLLKEAAARMSPKNFGELVAHVRHVGVVE